MGNIVASHHLQIYRSPVKMLRLNTTSSKAVMESLQRMGFPQLQRKPHQGQYKIIKQFLEMATNFISSVNKTLGRVGECVFDSEISKYEHSNRKFHYVHKAQIEVHKRTKEMNIKTVKELRGRFI